MTAFHSDRLYIKSIPGSQRVNVVVIVTSHQEITADRIHQGEQAFVIEIRVCVKPTPCTFATASGVRRIDKKDRISPVSILLDNFETVAPNKGQAFSDFMDSSNALG